MRSQRHIFWFVTGFLASALAGLVVRPQSAAAQTTATQVAPLPARKIEPQRRLPRPDTLAETDDTDTTPAPTVVRTGDDGEPLDANPDAQDGDDPQRTQARRNIDGEPLTGVERAEQRDGQLPVGETLAATRDGETDTDRDPRLKADIDAFEKPAAGYDATAFQIELDPVLDRRPARLARFEPYDPIGIRRGAWIIFPELEFGIGASSNIRRSPNKDSAALFDLRPTVRAVTNWRVHAIELKATGFASALPGFASENDKAYAVEARGRYDFSKRTNFEVLVSHQLDQEGRQARDAVDAARERSDIATNRAAVALNHRLNRLGLQLRGSVTDIDYSAVTTVTGGQVTNAQRDVVERGTAARATWEFKPTLFAFTELALNDRTYKQAPTDGISRNSKGLRALAGIGFGSTSKTWRGEVAIGYGVQRPDDSRLRDVDGMIIDANLGWRINELSSLLLTARTDFNDSTTVGQSGSTVRTVGIEGRHALRRHLIATAAVRHAATDYRGISLSEQETTGELGLEYFLNRTTTLTGKYTHVNFNTSTPAGDYTVDSVRFGVRVRQ